MPSYKSNRYAGKCHVCGRVVRVDAGYVTRAPGPAGSRWVTWCVLCLSTWVDKEGSKQDRERAAAKATAESVSGGTPRGSVG